MTATPITVRRAAQADLDALAVLFDRHRVFQGPPGRHRRATAARSRSLGERLNVVDPFWLVFFRWGIRAGHDMRGRFPAYSALAERPCSRASVQRVQAEAWA